MNDVGLYDSIVCEYPLPFPNGLGECKDHAWGEHVFQTKSFVESALEKYTITEHGDLYKDIERREWNGNTYVVKSFKIEKQEYTGEIFFFDYITKDTKDYWMEFVAVYFEGKLIGIKNIAWEEVDNVNRKQREIDFSKMLLAMQERNKKIHYKIFNFLKYFLGCTVRLTRIIFILFAKVLNKIENAVIGGI